LLARMLPRMLRLLTRMLPGVLLLLPRVLLLLPRVLRLLHGTLRVLTRVLWIALLRLLWVVAGGLSVLRLSVLRVALLRMPLLRIALLRMSLLRMPLLWVTLLGVLLLRVLLLWMLRLRARLVVLGLVVLGMVVRAAAVRPVPWWHDWSPFLPRPSGGGRNVRAVDIASESLQQVLDGFVDLGVALGCLRDPVHKGRQLLVAELQRLAVEGRDQVDDRLQDDEQPGEARLVAGRVVHVLTELADRGMETVRGVGVFLQRVRVDVKVHRPPKRREVQQLIVP